MIPSVQPAVDVIDSMKNDSFHIIYYSITRVHKKKKHF